jgi:HNH endonuclease
MHYWWVNQNQTYKSEVPGGFLWSPKKNKNGARNQFYENMKEVSAGDIVFSFCDTYIKAVGRATGKAESSVKPDFGQIGSSWDSDGWLVPVEFVEIEKPFRPRDQIALIRPHLPTKYSPLQSNGNGLQSVYLAAVPDQMARVLIKLLGDQYESILISSTTQIEDQSNNDEQVEQSIRGRSDIGATEKKQLVLSRRGQGVFKANVRLNESACRVTGISDPKHLRASHIKPWSKSNDEEKLHGCNGLLLAPHVDHLFDKGYISFEDDGQLVISPKLSVSVLTSWNIPKNLDTGKFNREQASFLTYHRKYVLKR